MQVITVNPLNDATWKQLVEAHPYAGIFHSPQWVNVIVETYGFEPEARILVDDDGTPRAGIHYMRVNDMMGPRTVSLTFSDFCDPLVTSEEEWHALIDDLVAEERPMALRCLHNDVPLGDDRFKTTYKARWHGLTLERDVETRWMDLHPAARRAIRKAEGMGVEVQFRQDEEAMRAFFEMHLGIRKYKYQLIAQPYSFFQNILRYVIQPADGAVALAMHDGEPVGGTVFLTYKNTLYYKFNASSPHHLEVRPNDLIVWQGIQYGTSKGLKYFDFGLSDWDQEGLIRYKRKFADDEGAISFLKLSAQMEPTPETRQMRGLLPQLTDMLTDEGVPDAVTEQAGAVLYRYFT